MISDDLGKQLHDRATRGETLSTEEQRLLEEWYVEQDRIEMTELGLATETEMVASLQSQVDSALAQLTAVTKRIQEIAEENETLRREIAALRQQLVQQVSPHPA
jgi:peptidoglycan hydrolase CwlO-like protein